MTDPSVRRTPTARRLLVAGAVVLAVALAGCSVLSANDPALPDGSEAAESYRSLDGYSATATIERTNGLEERLRIWIDPDDGNARTEMLAPPAQSGNLNLANGSHVVRYNATKNEYVVISTSGFDRFERGAQRIEEAVDDVREDGETTTDAPAVGGAPLPVVPDGEHTPTENAQFTVQYDGVERVAGRAAHVLNYTAAGNRSHGVLRQRVWLDTDYFVTLKSTQVSRFGANRTTYSFELSNVSFDTEFSASRFAFDPPAGATVNESESYDLTSYDSLSGLSEQAAIPVPDPDVPDRYQLVTADRIVGLTFNAIQLRYRAGTSALYVTKTTEQSYTNTSEGEPVSIGTQTGRYRSTGVESLVIWECGDYIYTVTGDVQRTTLLDVARSVGCH